MGPTTLSMSKNLNPKGHKFNQIKVPLVTRTRLYVPTDMISIISLSFLNSLISASVVSGLINNQAFAYLMFLELLIKGSGEATLGVRF